jgi:hypothetical protein
MLSDYHGVHCSCFTFVDEDDDLEPKSELEIS